MTDKCAPSAAAALDGLLRDGTLLALGGFGPTGVPELLLREVARSGARDLTVVCCSTSRADDVSVNPLILGGQVRRVVTSFIGPNPGVRALYLRGELDVQFVPQGTLAERLRAGGAGIPAFYTPVGAGTVVAEGKPTAVFGGRECVLEEALVPEVSLVRAWKADRAGNLVYRRTARNFNPDVAAAGRITVAEVEEIVEPGELDPDQIHTPGIYVQRLVLNPHPVKTYNGQVLVPVSEPLEVVK